jgi:uncharacterized protein (TIGR00730 family)
MDEPIENGHAERTLLEGPHSRLKELGLLLGAARDFLRGFRALHFAGPCVTVFGSARFPETHPFYALTRRVGARLSQMGFTVMTGGGPGLMEAANRGAHENGGTSVGCNIHLPKEQQPNPYLDRQVTCEHMFVRKVLLFKYSYAFVAMPGGMGTMDELFEALTLIQTRKVERFPVVLLGTRYWQPVLDVMTHMAREGMIDSADLTLAMTTDDVDEAVRHIERCVVERIAVRVPAEAPRRPAQPSWRRPHPAPGTRA